MCSVTLIFAKPSQRFWTINDLESLFIFKFGKHTDRFRKPALVSCTLHPLTDHNKGSVSMLPRFLFGLKAAYSCSPQIRTNRCGLLFYFPVSFTQPHYLHRRVQMGTVIWTPWSVSPSSVLLASKPNVPKSFTYYIPRYSTVLEKPTILQAINKFLSSLHYLVRRTLTEDIPLCFSNNLINNAVQHKHFIIKNNFCSCKKSTCLDPIG